MREPLEQFFQFDGEPDGIVQVAKPYYDLMCLLHEKLPKNSERLVALRKLLDSREAAIRSLVFVDPRSK